MKKLLRSISMLILLSVGLFSCKTASVMKRHYNKGFYVNKTHAPDDTKSIEQTARKETKKVPELPAEKLAVIPPSETKQDIIINDEVSVENLNSVLASMKEQKVQHIGSSFSGTTIFKEVKKLPRELKSAVAASDDVARDALSLLWILIAALLVIYIVGLLLDLFGIGPVFHVLGVIILVLLILWLLRII